MFVRGSPLGDRHSVEASWGICVGVETNTGSCSAPGCRCQFSMDSRVPGVGNVIVFGLAAGGLWCGQA